MVKEDSLQNHMESKKKVSFTKMHGAGNDYVYVNAMEVIPDNLPHLSRQISDRHFGIGSDGLVVIMRSETADFRMRMFNADGSEAEMCGNASRCIGKYVYEKGLTAKTVVTLETLAGIKVLRLEVVDGEVVTVTVDMGEPELRPAAIPVISSDSSAKISEAETVGDNTYLITAVSMGNPHAVVFTDTLDDSLVCGDGSRLECAPIFPDRANIEFARIIDRNTIEMRVWERGSGETLACGTGACATVVAAVLNGLADRHATVRLLGGDLEITWDEKSNHVFLKGGAEFIADGEFILRGDAGAPENPAKSVK